MRLTPLILITATLAACSSSSRHSTSVRSPEDVKSIYRESGLPRSSKYDPDIQGVPSQPVQVAEHPHVQPATPSITVSPVPVHPAPPAPVEPTPSTNPWEENGPISPEEGQALAEQAQRANDVYQEAKGSEDPKVAAQLYAQSAQLYIAATRYPDDAHRNNCLYNAACCYALMGQKAEALRYLRLSLQFGFDQWDHIAKDEDFDSIRGDDAFKKLIAEFQEGRPKPAPAPAPAPVPQSTEGPTDNELYSLFEKADALYEEKKFLEAAEQYLAASALESLRPNALYNAACSYALAGEKDKAVEQLKKAIEAGYTKFDRIKSDTDLDPIREHEGYKALLQGK